MKIGYTQTYKLTATFAELSMLNPHPRTHIFIEIVSNLAGCLFTSRRKFDTSDMNINAKNP